MQPEQQGKRIQRILSMLLRYAAPAVFAVALALLAFFYWQLHLEFDHLKDSLESNAMSIETVQSSMDQLDRPKPVFFIARFDLNYKKDEYGEGYSGTAIISCDLPDASIVILKTTLLSGGSAYTEEVSYSLVIVQDGIGRYPTYDWGETGKIEKPEYQFEVIGYVQMERGVE